MIPVRALEPTEHVLVKICCISSIAEAELALEAGADALGLVSAMPSGPGVIPDARIAEIAEWVGARAARVLLTSRQRAEGISEQVQRAQVDVVQVVDEMATAEVFALRAAHPQLAVMQVIHVRDASALDEAIRAAGRVDALLLDSGNPAASVRELGGTGRVHDWNISRSICAAVAVPVFLAGGLNAENVAEAIRRVRPRGVDVCSGVRREGRLDSQRLGAFMAALRHA